MYILRGIVFLTVIVANTVLCCVLLYPLGAVRGVCRRLGAGRAARALSVIADGVIDEWTGLNRLLMRWLRVSDIELEVDDRSALARDHWYLVICNHQTWADILVLQTVFRQLAPPLRFFTKQQLIWIPLFGVALWLLDFPFVRRISRAQIEANPALAAIDRAATQAACARFLERPTGVLNFLEGTRFTPEKRALQNPRFRHLLNPKLGGVSTVVDALATQLHRVLDVTICYPEGTPTFWQFLTGRAPRVICTVRVLVLPDAVHAAGDVDAVRATLAPWIESIWHEKDATLERARYR